MHRLIVNLTAGDGMEGADLSSALINSSAKDNTATMFASVEVNLLTGAVNPEAYLTGIRYDFKPFYITYSLVKSSVFAFIITSVSAFYGYYAKGNSLEVGKASTRAVVASSIVIMIFNLILTQILLT